MATAMNEEELIKSRPLLFESRPFSRITKRNSIIQTFSPTTTSAPASTFAQQHADIDLDFNTFFAALTRIQLLLHTNAREVSRYADEKARIELTAEEARSTLIALRESLERSQQEKLYRLEYDRIAQGIVATPRAEQNSNIARLNAEIAELERERDEYRRVWQLRRAQFEEIVKQLEVMSAQIREDKDEQDRREGMSEEEEEEGEEGEIDGGKASGGATPADEKSRLGVPGAGLMVSRSRGATPNVGSGATPQPMVDEKEEGEEDDDIDLTDAPPLRNQPAAKKPEVPDRMDTS